MYSVAIVWTTISPRAATVLTFVLMGFGIVAGLMADQFYQREMAIMFDVLEGLN